MAQRSVIDILRRFIADVCAVDLSSIHPHSKLLAFGLDSVRLLDLLLAVEEQFGLELNESDPALAAVETVGDLAELIERRRAAGPGSGA
ncbi:MAG TPA: acyl carrier protein [Kofleriaceae bacterium]|nr:acyl carrier protein [Kofleriaceae bacterium]